MPRGGKRQGAGRKPEKPEKPESGKAAVGAPSSYRSEFAEQAEALCKLGATDIEIADFFHVYVRTIYAWASRYQEFKQALKSGKAEADDRVERSLYHRANGYSYDAVKIMAVKGEVVTVPYREHVPPDTTAAIFWLKNRRRDEWRDKIDHEHAGKDGAPLIPILNVTIGKS